MKFDIEAARPREIYNLLIGLVAPRPIALITTMEEDGTLNAAPFSAYNYLCTDPPIVGVGVANRSSQEPAHKDTARNVARSGEFVINVVTEDIAHQMNICATDFPSGVSELEMAKLESAPSAVVKVPRIASAHAALECVEHTTLEIGRSRIILGRVVSIYVDDQYVDPSGPYIRAEEMHAIGRMNGLGSYVRTRGSFMTIPRIPYADWEKK